MHVNLKVQAVMVLLPNTPMSTPTSTPAASPLPMTPSSTFSESADDEASARRGLGDDLAVDSAGWVQEESALTPEDVYESVVQTISTKPTLDAVPKPTLDAVPATLGEEPFTSVLGTGDAYGPTNRSIKAACELQENAGLAETALKTDVRYVMTNPLACMSTCRLSPSTGYPSAQSWMNMILASERFLGAILVTDPQVLKQTLEGASRWQSFALAMAEIPSALQPQFKQWTKEAFPNGPDAVLMEPWDYKSGTPKPTKRNRSPVTESAVRGKACYPNPNPNPNNPYIYRDLRQKRPDR